MIQKNLVPVKVFAMLIGISFFFGGVYLVSRYAYDSNPFSFTGEKVGVAFKTDISTEKINDATSTRAFLEPITTIEPTGSRGTFSVFLVGRNGGIIVSPDGKMQLAIPRDALVADSRIIIGIEDSRYDINPLDVDVLAFSKPALLSLQYNPAIIPPGVREEDMRIEFSGNNYGSFVNIQNHIIYEEISMIEKTGEEIKTFLSPSSHDDIPSDAVPSVVVRTLPCATESKQTKTIFEVMRDNFVVATVSSPPCFNDKRATVIAVDASAAYFSIETSGRGGYILYGGYDNLYRLNLINNSIDKLVDHVDSIVLSPNKRNVIFASSELSIISNKITLQNLETGEKRKYDLPFTAPENAQFGDFTFSPDSMKVAVAFGPDESAYGYVEGEQGGDVYVLNISDGSYSLFFTSELQEPHIRGWLNNETPDVYIN